MLTQRLGDRKRKPKMALLDFGRGKELARPKMVDGRVHYVSCREEAERIDQVVTDNKYLHDPDWQAAMQRARQRSSG